MVTAKHENRASQQLLLGPSEGSSRMDFEIQTSLACPWGQHYCTTYAHYYCSPVHIDSGKKIIS